MTITTRTGKGSELTAAEVDTNFTDLRDGIALQVPKTAGTGIKVDSLGTPTFGWHDIIGNLHVDEDDVNRASYAVYRGGLKSRQFGTSSEAFVDFHIPHDYLSGSDIFIHVHWSHISTLVTGGSVTWGFETIYSKGHDQGAFSSPILITVAQNASTVQYRHMIAETAASVSGGSANQLNTGNIEPDGVILTRIYLDSNDITVSGGGVPDPFVHYVDIHYQSTNVATKQRIPDFWT